MRAGRLLNLLLILQNSKRVTTAELAVRLGVSRRTVLRDVDELSASGVPVYGIRGANGGFELLDTFEQEVPPVPAGLTGGSGQLRRVRVRVSPSALQMALLTGKPEGWRPRPNPAEYTDRTDWIEGSFRFHGYDNAVRELLALGVDVEVLLPVEIRDAMADAARKITNMHTTGA